MRITLQSFFGLYVVVGNGSLATSIYDVETRAIGGSLDDFFLRETGLSCDPIMLPESVMTFC
jgi:hypothetical protein